MTKLLNHRQLLAFVAVAFIAVPVLATLWVADADDDPTRELPAPEELEEAEAARTFDEWIELGPFDQPRCVDGAPDPLDKCPAGQGDVRRTQDDRRLLGTPSFEAALVYDGASRTKELEVQIPAGEGPLQGGIDNPEPIKFSSQTGIALRTTEWGEIMNSSTTWTVERPAGCEDGCRLYLWLTMGPHFQRFHPEAEVVVFGGDDTLVTIEDLWTQPANMWTH